MLSLSSNTAIKKVRKTLDELQPNGSVMYGSENADNESLDEIIRRSIAEAANAVHMAAPVELLEGENISFEAPAPFAVLQFERVNSVYTGVAQIWLPSDCNFLRLVSFKAADSPIVLTSTVPQASPEGHKQLNPYIRGRYDRPVLVRRQGSPGVYASLAETPPDFLYYTFSNPAHYAEHIPQAIPIFEYIPRQEYITPTQQVSNPTYKVATRVEENVIAYLTALVMETYSDQRAQVFFTRAADFENV